MKILNALKWLTHTKLGWLIISFLWVGTFMIIDDNIESGWAFWVAMPGFIYMIGLFCVLFFYAIKNTISDIKENRKLKGK